MARHERTGVRNFVRATLAACLLAAALPAPVAWGVDVSVPIMRGPSVSQGDLQALQDRLSRQQFQQQQQQDRQQDRSAVPILPPRQEVPRMKPACQLQVNGSLADCR